VAVNATGHPLRAKKRGKMPSDIPANEMADIVADADLPFHYSDTPLNDVGNALYELIASLTKRVEELEHLTRHLRVS
jgi:hypothetical protein